ncbi:MAG: glycosyltransferase family 4 protein [Acidobacteria bacterium]|nr:glycosyltransferase family 4 protein [Acidobacteriota bacterium]
MRQVAASISRRRHEDGLTVAVDISPLYESLTGVGWYLHEVLRQLADRPGLRLRLYGPSMFMRPDAAQPVRPLASGRAIEWVRHELPDDLLVRQPWLAALLRGVEPWLVAADRNRVLFAPNFVLPWQLAFARRPLVVTVHDMTLLRTSWAMQEETRAALDEKLERTIARARAIVTPSETVRMEILEAGGAAPDAIHVTWEASRLERVSRGALPAAVPDRFVLHVGTIEPRKNVAILLSAWPRLRAMMQDAPPLVLCGKLGWQHAFIEDALDRASAEGWLIRLGYTPDEVLRGLYDRAGVVVCPSLYEGFGLPLVEAMAAGAPLVCSDIPVFREVAGEAAEFVPPDDAAGWAGTLARVLSEPDLRNALRTRGAARVRDFDWQRTADRTLAIWSSVAAAE